MSKKILREKIFGNSDGFIVLDIDKELISIVKKFIGLSIYKNIFPGKEIDSQKNIFDLSLNFLKENKSYTFTRKSRTIDKQTIKNNEDKLLQCIAKSILKPTHLVNNDLYYRVVRKNISQEISVIHRDIYFHNIQDEWAPKKDVFDVKFWFPLYQEQNKSLGVIPNSHLHEDFNDVIYQELNGKKYSFKCKYSPEDLTPIPVNIGQAIVFPSSLVHGSLNRDSISNLRVSAEFTLGYKFY